MKFTTITKSSLFLCAALAAMAVFTGCSNSSEPATAPSASSQASKPTPSEATPVAFTNASGKIICPVMGTEIESADKAVGYQDYNGKRYYFCCDGCPEQFKADPAKYANGKPD